MKQMSTKNKPVAETTTEPTFTKEILVNSKRFRNKQDIVSALLKNGAEYTISDVEGMIEKYMKGKVK
jgi:arginine repressor